MVIYSYRFILNVHTIGEIAVKTIANNCYKEEFKWYQKNYLIN